MTPSDHWRRLEEVFQAAVDIPIEHRDAWLNTACEGDSELRREVANLLSRDVEESPLISHIIQGTAANLFDDTRDEGRPDLMAGLELGSYRIIRELGRGGMGAVYLALRSDQAFEKQVAVKLVKRGIDTDAVLQRFWHERRILAALDHPYIARLLDGGTSPDGRPYFVMEYVDGKPLDVYVRDQGLSVAQCCELVRRVAEAVSYAHRNLIIHRDLKPGNILVTADGTPKLLDFGIARLLTIDPGEHTVTGPPGVRALTPDFASPEQMRGGAVTTATDVYSLGATLKAVLPAGVRIPPDLATIIDKATREEIDQRFGSVAELSEDLRRYLTGLPITAREQTVFYQVSRFVRRHRLGVSVLVLASMLAIGGVAAIVWESRQAEAHRKEAELRLSQAVEMAERALTDVNTSIANLPGATEARRKLVHDTLEYLDRLSKDSDENPRVLAALATAYVRVGEVLGNADFTNLGDLPGSFATYQKAFGVIDGLLKKNPDDLRVRDLAAVAHEGKGSVLRSMGRDADAEVEVRAAIVLAEGSRSLSPDSLEAQSRTLEAHFALDKLRYTEAPAEAEKDARTELPLAMKLAEAHPDNPALQERLAEFYAMIGTSATWQGRVEESVGYFRKGVDVLEAVYSKNPRNTKYERDLMIAYGHVGDALGSPFTGCLGDYQGGLEYYGKAGRLAEDMNRADPSDNRAGYDMSMVSVRIGATRSVMGDFKSSNEVLDRGIEELGALLKRSAGNALYARGIALAYEYRGRNMWKLGDRTAALAWCRKSLAIADGLLAVRPADALARTQRVSELGEIASLSALEGDRSGALRLAALAIAEALDNVSRGASPYSVAMAWFRNGETYEALHDFRTAASAYGKSVEAWKKSARVLTGTFAMRMHEAEQGVVRCEAKGR